MKILGICGSLRRGSSNEALLRAALAAVPDGADGLLAAPVDRLPHFNPDLDDDDEPPAAVSEWRAEIAAADAIVLSSPEYAHGIPGALKNALDWVVSSGEFYDKPVALITSAAGDAQRVQASLMRVLKALGALLIDDACVTVVGARRKIDETGRVTDAEATAALRAGMGALAAAVEAGR